MSNLLKSVYFNVNRSDKVIIDSNKKKVGTPIQPPPDVLKSIPGFDFVPGMNVLNVDQIIKDEKGKTDKEPDTIISDAQKRAEDIVAKAKRDAKVIKEKAHQEGLKQGHQEGLEQSKKECQEVEQSLLQQKQAFDMEYSKKMNELEPLFAELTGKLVEKITGVLMEDNKEVVFHVLSKAIRNAPKSDKYTIQASKEDVYFLETKKEQLKACLKGNAVLHVVENDSLEKNQCIIETDNQMMDCSLDVQLKRLSEELKILSITE